MKVQLGEYFSAPSSHSTTATVIITAPATATFTTIATTTATATATNGWKVHLTETLSKLAEKLKLWKTGPHPKC